MLTAGDTLYQKFSESKLYHVDVLAAGMGLGRQVRLASGIANMLEQSMILAINAYVNVF